MDTAIVVFTRDLRLHDNPALHQACARARQVVPLFVLDPAIAAPANRARFLAESLADLRASLRERGANLVLRRGDPAAEVIRLAGQVRATAVYIADDVSHYAAARRHRLERECGRHRIELTLTPGLTVVPPADLKQAGGGHYRVFTPYWRPGARPPGAAPAPSRRPSRCPRSRRSAASRRRNPPRRGWPRAARRPAASASPAGGGACWPATPRITTTWPATRPPGCPPPPVRLPVAARGGHRRAGPAGRRRAGRGVLPPAPWRDFFYQVTAAFPDIARKNYRPGAAWHEDPRALDAWREGQTGIPIVDAGMRQLAAEGFMHNRARMVTASFLTRNLGIDWRHGSAHFDSLLADGDVANNAGNWQWVAGTGNDTRPNRVMNPLRQAQRFDRSGEYVRRYLPELAGLAAPGSRRRGSCPPPSGSGWAIRARWWSWPDPGPQDYGGVSTVSMMYTVAGSVPKYI